MTAPTSRLLNLLSLLQARRDWPGGALAERLGVSHRTVRRDVDRLREMGYRIRAARGPAGGYRLDAGSELPPLLFDDDQAVALAVALETATASGAGVEEAALRALTSIRQVLPPRLRHRLDGMSITTLHGRPGDAPAPGLSTETLLEVSAAIRARQSLRFDYSEQPGSTASRHHVEPHHLMFTGGRWYLVSWDPGRGDWRIHRVDRMTPRPPHGHRFAPRDVPGGDVAEFVSARFKGSERANEWPCVGSVVVHLPAHRVRPFAGDGLVEEIDDARCTLEAGSWSWVALASSLNRFDTDIEVVEPPALRDAFRILAERNAATARSG